MLTLKNAPAPSLFNAINKGGQSLPAQATEFPQETSPLSLPLHQFVSGLPPLTILAMALDSVPTYLSDLG